MSDTQLKPLSNITNTPDITHYLYLGEKFFLAGIYVSWVSYGALMVLTFKCVTALLNPVSRKVDGIKWGLVSYTVVMFSVVTVATVVTCDYISLGFIDNRASPGGRPLTYLMFMAPKALGFIPTLMGLLNYWLADALLLYRCYIVYVRNPWVIFFPCFVYLCSVGTGIATLISQIRGTDIVGISILNLSISVSLNVLLTLTIIIRLVLYGRSVRAATGSRVGISGMYKFIITIFIESSALYTATSLSLILLWATRNIVVSVLILPVHAETQVIAPLLIIQRVANRSAMMSDTIKSGYSNSLHFRSRGESTGDSHALSGGYPMGSVDNHGRNTNNLGIMVETRVDPQGSMA